MLVIIDLVMVIQAGEEAGLVEDLEAGAEEWAWVQAEVWVRAEAIRIRSAVSIPGYHGGVGATVRVTIHNHLPLTLPNTCPTGGKSTIPIQRR